MAAHAHTTHTHTNGTAPHADSDSPRIGVVLFNLGGPTDEASVKTFLYNLFIDPDIIKLGGGRAQRLLARFISSRRAPKVAPRYREINVCSQGCDGNRHCPNKQRGSDCCSPINPITEGQRCALEAALQRDYGAEAVRVYTAMRYWKPSAEQTLADMKADGITHAVLLPLYPQFSWTTTGSSLREWQELVDHDESIGWQSYPVKNYYQKERFHQAFSERIDDGLARFDEADRDKVHIVFSAHGTPLAEVRSGDPYTFEISRTIEAIMDLRGHDRDYWIAFQSRVGPAKWTQPNTEDLVKRLLNYGIRRLLIVPVAFTADHIETLMELSVELIEDVEGLGLKQLEVTEGLNSHPLFIDALADEVRSRVAHLMPAGQSAPDNDPRTQTAPNTKLG